MRMREYFLQAYKTTNDNIILAIPLILFMWVVSAYMGYIKWSADSWSEFIVALVTVLFMFGAFMSGWFYMVKKAVKLSKKVFVMDEDKAKETLNLFKVIPAGIGKYFLPCVGMSILFMLLASVFVFLSYKAGVLLFGNLDLDPVQIKQALANTENMKQFVYSLSDEQLNRLSNWNLLLLFVSGLFSFLTLFWIPEMIINKTNFVIALWKSIKNLFSKFLNAILLFLYLTIINFVLSLMGTFSMTNPILYTMMMIVYFYFIVYIVVLIFSYYDAEFAKED